MPLGGKECPGNSCRDVEVKKEDPNGNPIEGITFEAVNPGNHPVRTATTDEHGKAILVNVHNGQTFLSEVAKEGYTFCSATSNTGATYDTPTFEFQSNKDYSFTFVNAPPGMDCDGKPTNTTGSISIKKLFQGEGEDELYSATFELTSTNGYSQEKVIGNGNTEVFENLLDDTYTLKEYNVIASTPYRAIDDQVFQVENGKIIKNANWKTPDGIAELQYDEDEKLLVVTNQMGSEEVPKAELKVKKTFQDSKNQDSSLIATFTLTGTTAVGTVSIGPISIADDKSYTFENLAPGNYTLTEDSSGSPKYGKVEPWKFIVTNDGQIVEDSTMTMFGGGTKHPPQGSSAFEKKIENPKIKTAELEVEKKFEGAKNGSKLKAKFVLTGPDSDDIVEEKEIQHGSSYTFENLKPGTYTLTEVSNSDEANYGLVAPRTFTVSTDGTIVEGATVTTFGGGSTYPPKNSSKIKIKIDNPKIKTAELKVSKKFKGSNSSSLTATFQLTGPDSDDLVVGKPVIIRNGSSFTFEKLKPGTYTLTEVSNSDEANYGLVGSRTFVVDTNGHITEKMAVTLFGGSYNPPNPSKLSIEIENTKIPKAQLTVKKTYEGLSNTDLKAIFELTGPVGYTSEGEKEIGTGGYTFKGMIAGDYTLTEISSGSPEHNKVGERKFKVDENGHITETTAAVLFSGGHHQPSPTKMTINIENPLIPTAELTINKTFQYAGEGNELQATFKLTGPNGYEESITVPGGVTNTFTGMKPGTYMLSETGTPNDYIPMIIPKKFTVNPDGTIGNTEEDTHVVNIENKKKLGSLAIWKVDPNHKFLGETVQLPLSGAKFVLLDSKGNKWSYEQETVFGATIFVGIPYGEYRLVEIVAPTGYEINPDYAAETIGTYTIHDGVPITINAPIVKETVNNTKKISKVILTKYQDNSTTPVEEAIFDLYKKRVFPYSSDLKVKTGLSTNINGEIEVSDLEKGTYYFIETSAPYGYKIMGDGKSKSFTITQHGDERTVTVYNEVIPKGSVTLTKYNEEGSQTPKTLAGATFAIYQGDDRITVNGVSEWTTEADGTLTVDNLLIGSYVFIETEAPTDYVRDQKPIPFEVTAYNETEIDTKVEAYNKLKDGSVQFTKVSNNEGHTPLQGAEFELQDEFGNVLETGLKVKDDGTLKIDLTFGKYQLVETKAPKYHVLDQTPIPFTLSEESLSESEDNILNFGNVVNEKGGDIRVEKVDAANNSIKLLGAVFQLLDDEVVIATATSGENGIATFEGIRYGSYTIKELTAPEGYLAIASDETISVTLVKGTDEAPLVTVKNQKIHESFTVRKVNAANPTGLGLPGAVFKVKVQVPTESSEGPAVFEDVDGMSNLVTNASGEIPETQLPPGKYQLVEIQAPAGYTTNSTPIPFDIVKDQTTVVSLTVANNLISTPPGPGPSTETGGGGGGGGTPPTTTIVLPTPQPQVPFVVVPRAPGVPVTVGEELQPEGPNVTVPEEPQPEGPNVTVEEPEGPSVTVEEEPQPEGPSVTVVEQPRPTLPRTGEGVPVGVLAAGLALTLLGGWLLFGRRRKEDSQL